MNHMTTDSDTATLAAAEYHRIVSPALQVTAELAAVRGDPELYNDMASMLALRALVTTLGQCYLEDTADVPADTRAAIEAAPEAACTMVLQRAELDQTQFAECLWALDAAERKLATDHVLETHLEPARAAWRELDRDNRDHALARLKFAAGAVVTAIDNWERQRDAENDPAMPA